MQLTSLPTSSITKRLIDRYLMFGLACVFGSVSLVLTLAWRGTLLQFVAVTVAVPLSLLLIGAVVLRRTVRLTSAIEDQLRQITTMSSALGTALRPLADSEPLAVGWNVVLQQLRQQDTLSTLESRLSDSLNNSEGQRWEVLFNSLSDGIAVCDTHDHVVRANSALLAMFGFDSKEQVVGKVMSDLLAAATHSVADRIQAGLSDQRGIFTTELHKGLELSVGVWRLCRTPIQSPLFPESSSLWTFRDITQQKLADEMRNQFVSTATHELRTPLANIRAYAETLAAQDDIDIDRQKSFYNIINMEATRLGRFVDELLNVSQMEAGAISVVRQETDIERLLREVIEHLQPQIEQKQLHFESRLPPKFPKPRVDKDKISGALVNLLGNAVKYTPDGGQVRLLVEVEDSLIHFHVEDTGIGIAPEELPRLCEKFFRSQDSRVQSITGNGLGLSFSQEVARLHGGKVSVRSELNKGSRFTLTLPLS